MVLLYTVFTRLYFWAIRLAARWNPKAREWVQGRREIFSTLDARLVPGAPVIWFHCASAGELEQGKPLLEALKAGHPACQILLTVFSPSGYAVARNYPGADLVTYLPADSARNARRFLARVQPQLVVFVKYEFWYHTLAAIARQGIPLLLVSAVFRPGQVFFQWYGGFARRMLQHFRHLFVQDEASLRLLQEAGIRQASIGGDTRFDRVQRIAEAFTPLPLIESFTGTEPVIVAGSTWEDDEALLEESSGFRLIIAPHQLHESHLQSIEKRFPGCLRYSALEKDPRPAQVLLIDNVGLLSRLYRYATVTYVGGGFTRDGIHNILEAAVWEKPVVFGPNYGKYREAEELLEAGGALSVGDKTAWLSALQHLQGNPRQLARMAQASGEYIRRHTGATRKILDYLQENRLLTRW